MKHIFLIKWIIVWICWYFHFVGPKNKWPNDWIHFNLENDWEKLSSFRYAKKNDEYSFYFLPRLQLTNARPKIISKQLFLEITEQNKIKKNPRINPVCHVVFAHSFRTRRTRISTRLTSPRRAMRQKRWRISACSWRPACTRRDDVKKWTAKYSLGPVLKNAFVVCYLDWLLSPISSNMENCIICKIRGRGG